MNQGNCRFHVWTDYEQAHRSPEDISYTIEIVDINDGEIFELVSEDD
jgi:hypothetical protein